MRGGGSAYLLGMRFLFARLEEIRYAYSKIFTTDTQRLEHLIIPLMHGTLLCEGAVCLMLGLETQKLRCGVGLCAARGRRDSGFSRGLVLV